MTQEDNIISAYERHAEGVRKNGGASRVNGNFPLPCGHSSRNKIPV